MWEIENNPDILALDKDPEAEDFLCDIYEQEKPSAKIPDTNTDGIVEKSIDAENPEINDVEGIMNLGENEWNEIFTIEEQEIHNNSAPDSLAFVNMSPVRNNVPESNKTAIIREAISISPTKIKICQTSVPVISEPPDELYTSALRSNCKVTLEKLSLIQINRLIQSNFSVGLLEDSHVKKVKKSLAATNSVKSSQESIVESKPKKIVHAAPEMEKIVPKLQVVPEQRKPTNSTKATALSTINKNSVSRIVDAISIDSDDNQSCVIVSSPKTKVDLKRKQEKIENELKVLPTIKLKLVRPNEETEKNDKLAANSDCKKVTCKPKFKDRKIIKKDWSNKSTNGKPITFENFFNKKFSILGSGLKIGKKASTQESDNFTKMENEDDRGDQWSSSLKNGSNNQKSMKISNDDDNEDSLWPKMKEQDEFEAPGKSDDIPDDYGDFAADDDDDCLWPVAKDEDGNVKFEKKSTDQNEVDDEENEAAQKWYSNNEEPDEENVKKNQSKDPWSNYLSKNKNVSQLESAIGEDAPQSDNLLEFADSDTDLVDVIVKDEPVNPPKKSVGNVWSHIQEYQSQFEKSGDNAMNYIEEMEDVGITDDVDETIKTMNYIKDAKWLNSKNEDFLDSYQSPADYRDNEDSMDPESHEKWYGQGKGRSPTDRIPSLMDIDTSRTHKGLLANVEKTTAPESWVDSGPPFRGSFRGTTRGSLSNRPHHHRQLSSNNYISPNSKQQSQSFQNMSIEQLFPPFKAEYFKNNNNNNNNNCSNTVNKSSEGSPNWSGKAAKSNHHHQPYVNSSYPRSFSKPPPPISVDSYCNGAAPVKTKGLPYGPPFPYYGDPNNPYHKESFINGFPMTGDSYNYYGNPFSKMNSYPPYYPPRAAAAVPITPESPDPPCTEEDNNPPPKSALKTNPDGPVISKKAPTNRPYVTQYHSYMTENGQYLPPYDDMSAAFFYHPCFGPPFGPMNPYTNPNQFYPYSQYDPVSYTPASPDPEEMCPSDKPNA